MKTKRRDKIQSMINAIIAAANADIGAVIAMQGQDWQNYSADFTPAENQIFRVVTCGDSVLITVNSENL